MVQRYAVIYRMQSGFVHSGAGAIRSYLRDKGDRLSVVCGPAPPQSTLAAGESMIYFLDVMLRVCRALDLHMNDEIGAAFQRIREASGLPPLHDGRP
jgi:hypothetical protein